MFFFWYLDLVIVSCDPDLALTDFNEAVCAGITKKFTYESFALEHMKFNSWVVI